MLNVSQLSAGYVEGSDNITDLSFQIAPGEILCLMGRNGAGKSTTLKSIMGLVAHKRGSIKLEDEDLVSKPAHEIPAWGVGYVPQGRRLFSELTVMENLEVGMWIQRQNKPDLESILRYFPVLESRLTQVSGTLSGGEQQMLAMARAMCLQPKVLLLDEPTEGLMPSMIKAIREVTKTLSENGVSVLLVEQRVDAVISIAHRVAFMENGQIAETLNANDIEPDSRKVKKYIGVGV